jgi:hypothetical protein
LRRRRAPGPLLIKQISVSLDVLANETYHKNQYRQQQEQHKANSRANKDKPKINNQFVDLSIQMAK